MTNPGSYFDNVTSITPPSNLEEGYWRAMSRPEVVQAYSAWSGLSEAEAICIKEYVKEAPRVLDLGCGVGRLAEVLGGKYSSYLGVDISSEMIAAARKRVPQGVFLTADIADLSLKAGSFDLILLMRNVLDILHPFSRRSRLIRKCRKWLSPNGVLIGSSHLLGAHDASGYYLEDYHGASVANYRAPFCDFIRELESSGLEVLLAVKDWRDGAADWAYTVSRLPS